MDIAGRRTLYISAIIIFLVIAPLLLLYSQGYRYDMNTRSILHIGAISIDSVPRDASIKVDGIAVRRTTPTLIGNKYPGTYHILLTKQGYQPWSIDTTVAPSNTSPLNATLLPTSTTGHYSSGSQIYAVTPTSVDRKIAIAYGDSDVLTLGTFSFDTTTVTPLTQYVVDPADSIRLSWSPRGKYLAAIQPGAMLRVIDPVGLKELFTDASRHLTDLVWNPVNDNIVYAIGDGSLWEIDLLKKTVQVIASPHVVAAAFDGSTLWILRTSGNESLLERADSTSSGPGRLVRSVPSTSVTRMYLQSGRCIMLTPQAVYVFEIREGRIVTVPIADVETVNTAPNRNEVLLSSASEVWTLNLSTSNVSLVVRQSNIQSSAWFPNRDAVLVLSKDTIRIHDTVLRTVQAGQLGPFDRAHSIVIVDDKTVAVVSASSIDVISY